MNTFHQLPGKLFLAVVTDSFIYPSFQCSLPSRLVFSSFAFSSFGGLLVGRWCQCIHPSLFTNRHFQPGIISCLGRYNLLLLDLLKWTTVSYQNHRRAIGQGISSHAEPVVMRTAFPNSHEGARRIARWAVSGESPRARAGLLSQQLPA